MTSVSGLGDGTHGVSFGDRTEQSAANGNDTWFESDAASLELSDPGREELLRDAALAPAHVEGVLMREHEKVRHPHGLVPRGEQSAVSAQRRSAGWILCRDASEKNELERLER
eukprot:78818-Rhodomonas_salina.1